MFQIVILNDKPFFCLPGGPPSNEMAYMQLALPASERAAGIRNEFEGCQTGPSEDPR